MNENDIATIEAVVATAVDREIDAQFKEVAKALREILDDPSYRCMEDKLYAISDFADGLDKGIIE